jgi:putative proteasome-type protease
MTYCVGIATAAGLVFAADTRTNASHDNVRIHRKLHVFQWPGERAFVVLTAGNLATTQLAMARLRTDVDDGAEHSLRTFRHLHQVVSYVGEVLVQSQLRRPEDNAESSEADGPDFGASLLVGGQIAGEPPGLYMLYSIGNAIAASPETPYLQIGETKYGKPILDRLAADDNTLEDAARLALLSLDATMRSNLSVGMPLDLALLRTGALAVEPTLRLERESPMWEQMRTQWSLGLRRAVEGLPRFPWEQA